MSQVTVALEALSSDAARWQGTASTLTTASTACESLRLSDNELSWASQDTGLQATYEAVRAKVERLLSEGSTETAKIATALLRVKQVYQGSDQHAIDQLHGVWDVEK